MNALAIVLAALSAVGFAVSSSLQHHVNTVLTEEPGPGGLRALARRPWWVLGQSIALLAFTLHAVALHLGALIVVQPVLVSGIVLALPLRAVLARRSLRWAELATVVATAAGLGLFLVAAAPHASTEMAAPVALVLTALGVLVAATAAGWAVRKRGMAQATGYGFACGVLFGLTGGLVKMASAHAAAGHGFTGHVWSMMSSWPTWALVVTGISGVVLNQCAYRAAPLSASMPLLNIVDVLVAIGFGILVFGEVPAHSAPALLGEAVALALMGVGLRRLAREESVEEIPVAPPPEPLRIRS